jgi:multidrug efflux system membrane fusion protein
VAAARAAVRLDQAAVRLAEINLSYCSITSPINGRTGRRQVDPGNIVTANTGPILVNIKTVDPLYVDFTISERDFARVRDNMARGKLKVQIMAEEDGRGPCQGELQFADNTIDNSTGTVSLRAGVSNKKRRLWPGQYVTVKLIVETAENAVVVPGEAVQLGQKGMYLYVVTDDNKADLRDQIEVGDAEDGELIIEKGLRAGEKVVTSGQLGLSPGVKVQIITDQKEKPVSDPSPAKSGNKGSGEQ